MGVQFSGFENNNLSKNNLEIFFLWETSNIPNESIMNVLYFHLDDQILLTIIKINKFNHKYWLRESYFVIGISIKTLFYFSIAIEE